MFEPHLAESESWRWENQMLKFELDENKGSSRWARKADLTPHTSCYSKKSAGKPGR